MKKYWIGIFGQVRAQQKRFVRDKMALFFTFLFPLIFLLVFGSVFSNDSTSFNIAIVNNSQTEFAKSFVKNAKENSKDSILKIKDVKDMNDAREKMKRSELNGIVELPSDFGAIKNNGNHPIPTGTMNVLYAKGSEQAGNTLVAVMNQITNNINSQMGQPEAPLKAVGKAIGDEQLKSFDYIFTGLLTFSLISMGIFGLANQMPAEKKRGSYRRLRAAPFTSGQLIISTAIHYTTISLLSLVMMVVAGTLIFHFNMRGDWTLFVAISVLSAFMMVGIGLLIAGWSKNEDQSSALSNLISFPMMFLSGTFIPLYLFPEWLRSVAQFVPITPITDGFRLIMTEHASFMEVLPQFGIITAWTFAVYFLAIKLFRWE